MTDKENSFCEEKRHLTLLVVKEKERSGCKKSIGNSILFFFPRIICWKKPILNVLVVQITLQVYTILKQECCLIDTKNSPLEINKHISNTAIYTVGSVLLSAFFVYSKSEYTIESVSVPGRLHDNSSKAHPIVMKFCTQNCLINISVEFEDGNDSSRNG
jgi:hypothetical protein